MLKFFVILIASLLGCGSALASELVCEPVPNEMAEIKYIALHESDLFSVRITVPKFYDSMEFQRLSMRIKPKDDSGKDFFLDVELDVDVDDEGVSTAFLLKLSDKEVVALTAVYQSDCVSHLNILIEPPA